MDEEDELFDAIYEQFVVDNYYGGSSEPITPEHFKEYWGEMSEARKAELIERAKNRMSGSKGGMTYEKKFIEFLEKEIPKLTKLDLEGYYTPPSVQLLRDFAGCLVRITDDDGNEIGVGRLGEDGVVRATIDGKEYTKKLTGLVIGDD